MGETLTIRTSASTDVIKVVERGPQGPTGATGATGPQGPAGAAGASTWNDISGKPSTFTPSAHASTHHTGGTDPLTPANIGAAPAVNVIELTPDGTTTITTSQLPARGIAFIEGGGNFTVNLPTPDIRQSGLTFSVKTEHEALVTGDVFITVVHNAVNLVTAFELNEDESSLDFLWDGYAWTYSNPYTLRSFPGRVLYLPLVSGTLGLEQPADNTFRIVGSSDATKKVAFEVDGLTTATTRVLTVPDASGTIATTADFAAPPPIGSTTPNSGAFTTLTATNGTITASAPVLDLSQTWNNAAVTFTGLRFNVTNTASALGSRLLEFQVNGSRQLSFDVETAANRVELNTSQQEFFIRCNGVQMLRVSQGGNWVSSLGASLGILNDCFFARDGADQMSVRRGTNAQTFRLYGTSTSSTNYQRMTVRSVKQTLSALSGASATTTGTLIPDGAVVVGVTTRIATTITGASGYQVGDGTDADRWGDIALTAVGETSDNRDWTAGTIECFTAGGEITLTAKTANFTAGAIEICVFYLAGEAD